MSPSQLGHSIPCWGCCHCRKHSDCCCCCCSSKQGRWRPSRDFSDAERHCSRCWCFHLLRLRLRRCCCCCCCGWTANEGGGKPGPCRTLYPKRAIFGASPCAPGALPCLNLCPRSDDASLSVSRYLLPACRCLCHAPQQRRSPSRCGVCDFSVGTPLIHGAPNLQCRNCLVHRSDAPVLPSSLRTRLPRGRWLRHGMASLAMGGGAQPTIEWEWMDDGRR